MKKRRVQLNTDAAFECEVSNKSSEALQFKWKKNDEELDISDASKYEYVVDGNKHKLIIKSCTAKDVGRYEIYLANPIDYDISSSANLEVVKGNSARFPFPPLFK